MGLGTLTPVSGGHGRHTWPATIFFREIDCCSARPATWEKPAPDPDRARDMSGLYNYQIYSSKPDGSDLKRLTQTQAYDAEATVCRDGSVILPPIATATWSFTG